jgi:hypothetical protein
VPVPTKLPPDAASYHFIVPELPVVDRVDVPLPHTEVAKGLPTFGASTLIVTVAVVADEQASVTVTV